MEHLPRMPSWSKANLGIAFGFDNLVDLDHTMEHRAVVEGDQNAESALRSSRQGWIVAAVQLALSSS